MNVVGSNHCRHWAGYVYLVVLIRCRSCGTGCEVLNNVYAGLLITLITYHHSGYELFNGVKSCIYNDCHNEIIGSLHNIFR